MTIIKFEYVYYVYRDYRKEWESIRHLRATEAEKEKQERLEKLAGDVGEGKAVPLIGEIGSGREIVDIYLKHPANESSDDSGGEENAPQISEQGMRLQTAQYLKENVVF